MKKSRSSITSETVKRCSVQKQQGCFNAPCIFIEECTTLFDVARHYIQAIQHNTAMHTLKEPSLCSGTVFLTDQQTKGQGKFDRVWISEKKKSLLMVLLLAQSREVQANKWNAHSQLLYNNLVKAIALAIVQSIQHCYTLADMSLKDDALVIKEPNDVLLENKKIAGILIKPYLTWNLIGIGMNIKQYQWSRMSISGISPISLADVGIDINVPQAYTIVCKHIEYVLTMKEATLNEKIQLYMQR